MAFRDRIAAAQAAPAPAPEVEAEEVAQVAAPEEDIVVATEQGGDVAVAANTGLSLFGMEPVNLGAVIEQQLAQEGSGLVFPMIKQTGAPSGRGAILPLESLDADIKDILPNGTGAFKAVLMGYRWSYGAFKWGFEKAPEGREDEAKTPAYKFDLPATNTTDVLLANKAASVVQFTKSEDRERFNFHETQTGHLSASLQLLVYYPDLNDLMIVSSSNVLDAANALLGCLRRLVDRTTGRLQPQVIRVAPFQITKPRSGYQYWSLKAEAAEDAAVLAAFHQWVANIQGDEDFKESVRDWLSCESTAITDEMRGYLRNFL